MRAIQFSEYGSPDVLKGADVPLPIAGPGALRIQVGAAGVNPADGKWRAGMFKDFVPIPLPHTLGYDVAGTVDAVGEGVTGFSMGDRVFAMLDPVTKGGYAEVAVVAATQAAKVPPDMDLVLAATLPTAALTGVQLIMEHVRPQASETVLITGAVGAVGRFALAAARQAGVRVVAAVRSSRREEALALGASEVITLGEAASASGSWDHVADTVGGPEVAALCKHMRAGGRICTVSTTPIDPAGLPATPAFIAVRPDGAQLATIAQMVLDQPALALPVRRMPLTEAAQAHRLVEAGGHHAKVVLLP